MKFKQFYHHRQTWGFTEYEGRHRQLSLCWSCLWLQPETPDNCPIAQAVFDLDKDHGITTPVLECPEFEQKAGEDATL